MQKHEVLLDNRLDCLPMVWHALSSTTVSFYRSKIGVCDFKNIIIRQRIVDILLSNPWLSGRLIKSDTIKTPCIIYPTESAEIELRSSSIVSTFVDDSLFQPNLSYNALSAKLHRFRVPPGMECCDNDQTLFHVVLIESNNQEQFALFASLSHILGDAFSFYRIISMLDVSNPIESLSLERDVMSASELMDYHAGYHRSWYVAESPHFEAGFQLNMHWNLKTSVSVFQCQDEEIEKVKRSTKTTQNRNVTTNDIITSWLGQQLDSDFLTFTMNMRPLLASGSQDTNRKIGNYFRYLVLCRGEYNQPQQVRDFVNGVRLGFGDKLSRLPTVWQSIRQHGYANITNWVNLYRPINFPGCSMICHLPVYDPQFAFHFAIIFRLRDDASGVLLFSHNSIINRLKGTDSIIKE